MSLVDLRKALPIERESFDQGLQALRRARRYDLSVADGRDGLTEEERAAGLREGGALLLDVYRNDR